MEFINLTFKGIGPFVKEQMINFDELRKNSLFLLNGPTGSGKTTIFDSLCFALFEQTSNKRTFKEIRSDYIDTEEESFIYLIFTVENTTYEVKRTLSLNKNGEIKKNSILSFEDQILTSTKEVNDYIKDLIGLNEVQFKQIVMLPQGQFSQLLFSKTKDKQDIFRSIFNTSQINTFTNKINEDFKIVKSIITNIKSQLLQYCIDFQFLISSDVTSVDKNNMNSELDKLQIVINDKEENINTVEKKLESELSKVEVINSTNDGIAKYKSSLINKEELLKSKNKITTLESELKTVNKIKQYRSELEKRDNLLKNITELENKIQTETRKIIQIQSEIDEIGELNDTSVLSSTLVVENNKLNHLKTSTNHLNDLEEITYNLEEKVKELNINNEKFEIESKKYLKLQELYYNSLTKVLQDNLKPGDSCPVCGSKEHNLSESIVSISDTVSKEDLDKQEEFYKNSLLKNNQTKNQIEILEEESSKLKEKFKIDYGKSYKQELKIELESELDNLHNSIKALEKEIRLETNKREQFDILNKSMIETKTNISNYEETINDSNSEINLLEDSINKNLSDISNDFAYLLEQSQRSTDDLNEIINNYYKELEVNSSLLIEYKKYKDKDLIDLTETNNVIKKYRNELLNLRKELKEQQNVYSKNIFIYEKYTNSLIEFELNEAKYEMLNKLVSVCKGDLNKFKIPFETYIISMYFDEIINLTNLKLSKVTKGRFQIKRSDSLKGRGTKGLELQVYDFYNGGLRDISTVSGGESFVISLAMALSLSEFTSMNTQSVDINMLFIDEGFGTLDTNILDSVLTMLLELNTEGKLIGIISHVSELKDRIDNKLSIVKSKGGSEIL